MSNLFLLTPYKNLQSLKPDEAITTFLLGPDNSGNLVYLEILERLFGATPIHPWTLLEDPDKLAFDGTVVLLPWSNMICPHWSSELVDVIIKSYIDVIPISIGIQAAFAQSPFNFKMSEASLRLLQYTIFRGRMPGSRGKITERILASHGIESIPIGCPSCYFIQTEEIEQSLSEIKSLERSNIRIGSNNTLSGHHREETAQLMAWSQENSSSYILQSESKTIADVYSARFGRALWDPSKCTVESHKASMENLLFDYGYFNSLPDTWGERRTFFMEKAFLFLDSTSWSNHIKEHIDIMIGSRFHGNAIAMISGKPSICIPSDWRTFELCEFHSLPMLNIEALQNTERLPKIQIFDFNAMNKAKEAAISNFGKFLERNRLSMAPLYYIKKTLPNGPLVK